MRNLDETTITQAVLATHHNATNARLSAVMTSLVQHLHGFARDIKLTEAECRRGIAFLEHTAASGLADRSELALLSQVLGLSTLVLAQNRAKADGCTEAAAFSLPAPEQVPTPAPGARINAAAAVPTGWVQGTVRDSHARPVAHAQLQVTASGLVDGSPVLLQADAEGRFNVCIGLPRSQHAVAAGPVKRLLQALERENWRPAHLEFVITANGFKPLTTWVFREDDPHLGADPLFGVRASLIAQWRLQPAGKTPDGANSIEPFNLLTFDFVLAPA